MVYSNHWDVKQAKLHNAGLYKISAGITVRRENYSIISSKQDSFQTYKPIMEHLAIFMTSWKWNKVGQIKKISYLILSE